MKFQALLITLKAKNETRPTGSKVLAIIETRCTIITFTGVSCPSIFVTPGRRWIYLYSHVRAWCMAEHIAGVAGNFSTWLAYIIVLRARVYLTMSIISRSVSSLVRPPDRVNSQTAEPALCWNNMWFFSFSSLWILSFLKDIVSIILTLWRAVVRICTTFLFLVLPVQFGINLQIFSICEYFLDSWDSKLHNFHMFTYKWL